MIRQIIIAMTIVLLAALSQAAETPVLKTSNDKISYSLGVDMAQKLKQQGVEVNPDLLGMGMRDALRGEKLLMTEDEVSKTVRAFQAEFRKRNVINNRLAALDNKQAGDKFMAENKAKADVVTLQSGLQYKVIKAGKGRQPAAADTVECRYRGTLIDGAEFDSSPSGGTPATFKVVDVIPGWKEALQLMPVGSTWQLFIPPQLAYGARGKGPDIGPNATLVFELELLTVK